MPSHIYRSKHILKDGTIVIYEHEGDSTVYTKKYYEKKKNLNPKVECDICKRMIFPYYLEKHKLKKTCKPNHYRNKIIEKIPDPSLTFLGEKNI
jgi:hypothetical protein